MNGRTNRHVPYRPIHPPPPYICYPRTRQRLQSSSSTTENGEYKIRRRLFVYVCMTSYFDFIYFFSYYVMVVVVIVVVSLCVCQQKLKQGEKLTVIRNCSKKKLKQKLHKKHVESHKKTACLEHSADVAVTSYIDANARILF